MMVRTGISVEIINLTEKLQTNLILKSEIDDIREAYYKLKDRKRMIKSRFDESNIGFDW